MSQSFKRLTDKRVTTGMAMTSAPSLSTDGADISAWKTLYGDRSPRTYLAQVTGSTAATVTGAQLWLYFANLSAWFLAGVLNGGASITVTGASQGYAEIVNYVGQADRMAVVGTWSAGTPGAACTPLEE